MAAPMIQCRMNIIKKCLRNFVHRKLGCVNISPVIARSCASQTDAASQSEPEKIVIPRKIKRTETSILEALSSTVPLNMAKPHYRHYNDPFLTPFGITAKREQDMSKSAGKKAAWYVMDSYSQFFENRPMEDFSYTRPGFKLKKKATLPENTLEGLHERISLKETMNAYSSYAILRASGTAVPRDLQLDLLDLLSFYNSSDPPDRQTVEETFHHFEPFYVRKPDDFHFPWKTDGLAEEVFKEIEDPDSRAYCSLLRGRVKHGALRAASELYAEMKEKNIPVSLEGYNAAIIAVGASKNLNQAWNSALEILKNMKDSGIEPDLDTFNSVLKVISQYAMSSYAPQYAMDVIQEMRNYGIEPSLGSYYYLIDICYGNSKKTLGNVTSKLMTDVLDYLQDKEFTYRHPSDYDFFHRLMYKNELHHKDLELAYKIDRILNCGTNKRLLGNSQRIDEYCMAFVSIVGAKEKLDKFMEVYEKFIPYTYHPKFNAWTKILQALSVNDGYQFLPKLWEDFKSTKAFKRGDILAKLVEIMGRKKQNDKLQKKYMETVDYLLQLQHDQTMEAKLRNPYVIPNHALGELILICFNSGQKEKAWETFYMYSKKTKQEETVMREHVLIKLADYAIEEKDITKATDVCKLMEDLLYPKLAEVVKKVQEKLELSDEQKRFFDEMHKAVRAAPTRPSRSAKSRKTEDGNMQRLSSANTEGRETQEKQSDEK